MIASYRRRPDMRGMGDLEGGIESAVWPTTGDINTETQSLAITISSLGADYGNSSLSTADDAVAMWQRDWNAFVTDFLQWKDAGWFWNPTRRDALVNYRARFNILLAQYHNLGGSAQTLINPVAGDQPTPDSLDTMMSAVKWVGIGLIAAGVLKLANDSGLFRRSQP